MGRRKADYDSLLVQDFLNRAQAMAYTHQPNEDAFKVNIHPYVHTYASGEGMLYYVPELKQRVLAMVVTTPTK